MLITETTRTVVEIVSLVVGTVGVILALRRWKRSRKVPSARLNVSQPLVRRALRSLPFLLLPLGIAGFLWARAHRIEVLIVRDGHSVYGSRVLEKRLASSPLAFPIAEGDQENKPLFGEPCWTVNSSSKPMRVVSIEYPGVWYRSRSERYIEKESVTVLPGQRAGSCEYDYYGPEFSPPETWSARADQNPAKAFGRWLSWAE